MGRIISLFSLVLIAGPLLAQSGGGTADDSVGFTVKAKHMALTLYRDRNGKPDPTESIYLSFPVWFRKVNNAETKMNRPHDGAEITVRKVVLGGYQCVPQPGPYGSGGCPECPAVLTGSADHCAYGKEFWAPVDELEDGRLVAVYETGWSFDMAALNIPVKIRPRRGDSAPLLESDFNIGASFHAKNRLSGHKPYYISVVGFASIQAIRMDASNNTSLGADSVENPMAVAYGGGIIFELNKIQLGVLAGADAAFGDLSSDFVYQNAPWIGFGLGYDLFKPKASEQAIADGKAVGVKSLQ